MTKEVGEINIVGTSHISEKSVENIKERISEEEPDVVAVELDEKRYNSLMDSENNSTKLDNVEELKGKNIFKLLIIWILSYFQNKMGEKVGIKPGSDMKAAIEEAEGRNISISLIDRDIEVTIQRLVNKMGFLEKLKIFIYSFIGLFYIIIKGSKDINEELNEEFEKIRKNPEENQGQVEELTTMLRNYSPTIGQVFLDERDTYMARKLHDLRESGNNVVAVVGAAHQKGIQEKLEKLEKGENNLQQRDDLEKTKDKKYNISIGKTIGYTIALGVISLFFFLIMGGASNYLLLILALSWVLINGIPVFILTSLLGSHWKSSIVGFSVAWMTSINPTLAPGWIVGYVELKNNNKISSDDIKDINEIVSNPPETYKEFFKQLFTIPLFKFILIIASANIGSLIGTVVFLFLVLPYIGQDFELWQIIVKGFNNTKNILFY